MTLLRSAVTMAALWMFEPRPSRVSTDPPDLFYSLWPKWFQADVTRLQSGTLLFFVVGTKSRSYKHSYLKRAMHGGSSAPPFVATARSDGLKDVSRLFRGTLNEKSGTDVGLRRDLPVRGSPLVQPWLSHLSPPPPQYLQGSICGTIFFSLFPPLCSENRLALLFHRCDLGQPPPDSTFAGFSKRCQYFFFCSDVFFKITFLYIYIKLFLI